MNNETKVGAVVLAGIALLMGIVSFLGVFSLASDSYGLFVRYPRASGLKPGNPVNYVGVPVGKVEKMEVYGNAVRIQVSIKNSLKIPVGSQFYLGSEGMMGGMFIDIDPPTQPPGEYLKPGSEINGAYGATIDSFLASGTDVLKKLETMADSVNSVFADEKVQSSIKATVMNSKEITENINRLSEVFAKVAVQNQDELDNMVQQLNQMSVHMNSMAGRMDNMLRDVDNNGQTGRDVAVAMQNLKTASENVARITQSIEEVTGDPKTKDDIKITLKNTREASEKANSILGRVGEIQISPELDVKYGDKPDKYRVDANLRIAPSNSDFFLVGVSDIGDGNDLNLQYGKGNRYTSFRAGLVLGEPGAGVDVMPVKWFKLSADAYDPNDFKVRLGGEVRLTNNISLVGETLDARRKASDSTYVGVRGYF